MVILRGVGTGLVQRADAGVVGAELRRGALVKMDARPLDESTLTASRRVDQPDPGADLVGPAGQPLRHGEGGGEIGRFAENLALENHLRVHAEHEGVGMFPRHGAGLGAGVAQDDFPRREMERRTFLHVRRHDGKGVAVLAQKLPAAGRGGSEKQRREHGLSRTVGA